MKKALKGFVWVLLGILSAFVFAASAATGGFHPECFYDTGNVEDIYPFTLQQERPGLVYQNGADDFFTVTEDSVSVYLPMANKKWNYMVLDISHLNAETLTFEVSACDKEWNVKRTQYIETREGEEIFTYELPKCKNLLLCINNQKGKQFRFNKLQLRNRLFFADKKQMAYAGFAALFLYVGLSILYIILKKKTDLLAPLKRVERICFLWYLGFVSKAAALFYGAAGPVSMRISDKIKTFMRIAVLAVWLLAEMFMRGNGLRLKFIPFHYLAAAVTLLVFFVTSLEKPPERCRWNHTLVHAWFWFSVIMTLSGIAAPKRWPGVGVLFLTAYAVWFWIWGNRKDPFRILRDIAISLKAVFWITTLVSAFGRTYTPGVPYAGVYINQNVFVTFLIMLLAVDLAQAGNYLSGREKNPCLFVLLSAELCLVLFFLVQTHSRGGLLTGLAVFLVCFFRWMRGHMGNRKKLARFLLQTALLFFPVSYAAEASILYVQSVFTKRIEYAALDREDDWTLPDRMFCGEIVNASEDGGQNFSQIRTKSLDAMTSGRVTLWKTYIRKFNLWGHFYRETTNGQRVHSHNAFIFVPYLYGIAALIPYFIMWWMIFARAFRYASGRRAYDLLPLALAAGFFVQAMTDTLEEPFSMESWIVVYIVIGALFGGAAEKGRNDKV